MTFANATPILLALALLAGCNEPRHMNRTLSSWAHDLEADEDHKRRAAAEAMAAFGPQALPVVPKLITMLEDVNPGVQAFAEEALSKIGPEAIPQLEPVLDRPEPALQLHAAVALVGIDPDHKKAGETLAKAATGVGNAEHAKYAQEKIIKMGERGAALLIPYLDDPYYPVRLSVVQTLSKFREKGAAAMDGLKEKVANGTKVEIKVEAVKTLAAVGTREQLEPYFRELIESDIEEVATHAGVMLQYIGARESASGYEGGEETAAASPKGKKSKKKSGKKGKGSPSGFKMKNK